jgi:PTS system mannose-specific IIC component
MTIAELLPVVLLGAVLGLDVVSFPQAMISRPLAAATVAGALLGQPMAGLLVGAALELIALETLPFGASRYPEWGSAAVVGGTLFALQPDGRAGAMTLAVLGALATAWVGGWTMVMLRRMNGWLARRNRAGLEAGSRRAVLGIQMAGLGADFVRGGLLTALALLVLLPVTRAALAEWSLDARLSRAVVVGLAATVAVGATWKIFHTTAGTRWYLAAGLLVGLLLLVVQA